MNASTVEQITLDYSALQHMLEVLRSQFNQPFNEPIMLNDDVYICEYGYLHDCSKIETPDEDDLIGPFDSLEEMWRSLEL